jgi:soluble lytic murein transglycosylase-like protein
LQAEAGRSVSLSERSGEDHRARRISRSEIRAERRAARSAARLESVNGSEDASASATTSSRGDLDVLIASHAKANNIPVEMVHRIVVRESRYNPRAVGRGGAMGLMQIKHATARGLGYTGSATGLLDADTNLRYAVPYLAGAYRVARGDPRMTVSYYARGYYYAAKRQGISTRAVEWSEAEADRLAKRQQTATQTPSIFTVLFAPKAAAAQAQALETR